LSYWIIYFKTPKKISKGWDIYSRIYVYVLIIPLILIPIISSSFLSPFFGTMSYFKGYWLFFFALGLIYLGMGIKVLQLGAKLNRLRGLGKGKHRLITKGIYGRMRHPMYSAWGLIFMGLAYCLDSMLALFLTPLIFLTMWLMCVIEEKYILSPLFKDEYLHYKVETPNRLYPSPYNSLIIIAVIFTIWVGFINYDYLFL